MSDEIAVALIGASGTIIAAAIAACVAAMTIASEVRRARESREQESKRDRESRKHERQRDRDAHERERQKDREGRLHDLRRATYGGLVENAIRQGVALLVNAEGIDQNQVSPLVALLRQLMEAVLVASNETMLALIAAGRTSLMHTPEASFPREFYVGLDRFASWNEGQIDLLLEARSDLGFHRSDIEPLRAAWLSYISDQRAWIQRQIATIDARLAAAAALTAAPPSTPRE